MMTRWYLWYLKNKHLLDMEVTKFKWLVSFLPVYKVPSHTVAILPGYKFTPVTLKLLYLAYTVVPVLPFHLNYRKVPFTPVSTVTLSYCQFSSSWWPGEKLREKERRDTSSEGREKISIIQLAWHGHTSNNSKDSQCEKKREKPPEIT